MRRPLLLLLLAAAAAWAQNEEPMLPAQPFAASAASVAPQTRPGAQDHAAAAKARASGRAAAAQRVQDAIKADQARIRLRLARRAAGKPAPPLPPRPVAPSGSRPT